VSTKVLRMEEDMDEHVEKNKELYEALAASPEDE
jgi:hypothetical protein